MAAAAKGFPVFVTKPALASLSAIARRVHCTLILALSETTSVRRHLDVRCRREIFQVLSGEHVIREYACELRTSGAFDISYETIVYRRGPRIQS